MQPQISDDLFRARDRLLAGDVVAVPTETVYGLAASIKNHDGLRKIFALKERPYFDPLIVHVASLKEAASVVKEWPPLADFIARSFWPGPLTLVLPKADHVDPIITSGLDTVAVRYPSHPVVLDLIRMTGSPIAAPSANKFGRTSPSRAEHVMSEFPESSLLVIDGGESEIGLESTVVAFDKDESGHDKLVILRPGGVTEEMLKDALQKWSHPTSVARAESAASPGHLKHHYMPRIPLVIVSGEETEGLQEATRQSIANQLKLDGIRSPRELILADDAALAARELYNEMRKVAESGADLIYVRSTPERSMGGLWAAIWDRLTRAASLNLA